MAKSNGKGRGRRESVNLLLRRKEVFERWRNGETGAAIAKSLGVSPATVCSDLQISEREWREEHRGSVNQHVEAENEDLDWAKRESRLEWEKTRDPRFMDNFLGASDRKRKLLGLDAPARSEIKTDVSIERKFMGREEMFDFVRKGIERHQREGTKNGEHP